MIAVAKYDYVRKTHPTLPNYRSVLIHTTGPLSPYTMKNSKGQIMENIWQFSKIWVEVTEIVQPISRYMPDKLRWSHSNEIHFQNDLITPAYWKWRRKGMNHDKWVRYPNGYPRHKDVYGSVLVENGEYEIIDKYTARLKIYYRNYCEIARCTSLYKELQKAYYNGENILIVEVDGPTYTSEYPYNLTENGIIHIDHSILDALVQGPQAFGHGYSLAGLLLGWKFCNVGIVGSRHFTDYHLFSRQCNRFIEKLHTIFITVISGGAPGTDTMAEKYAKEKGYNLIVYKADWDKYGKSAGPRRNTQIVNKCDHLIAYISKDSVGTLDTVRKCKADGKKYDLYFIEFTKKEAGEFIEIHNI